MVLLSGVGYLYYWCNVAGVCICPTGNKKPQQGGPIAYAGEISPAFGFQQVFFTTMLTGLVTWRLVLPRILSFHLLPSIK